VIQLEAVSILLAYGVLVASIILFSATWFSLARRDVIQSGLKRLVTLGVVLGVLALWFWVQKWVIPYFEGDDYAHYALKERLLGPYGYGVWLPLVFSILATLSIVWVKTRKWLVSWVAVGVVGFGPILYELWMHFIVNQHREFLSTSYQVQLPEWYQILFTAIVAGGFCLLVALYPSLKTIHRK
jgi:hypothetical protein